MLGPAHQERRLCVLDRSQNSLSHSSRPTSVLDQATELRRLVRETASSVSGRGSVGPCLVAVAGGKGGVGTTTIAVNVAVALAQRGRSTVLIDLSPTGRDAAALCGLDHRRVDLDEGLGDSNLADLLVLGPSGVRMLAAGWSREAPWAAAEAGDRLLGGLASLGPMADFLVVDAGNSLGRGVSRLWRSADAILLVATPELASVMNAYAAVKMLVPRENPPEIFSVVSRAPTADVAADIHARLAQACRRFLGLQLRFAGYIPPALEIEEASRRGEPFVLASPNSFACRQILALSREIAAKGV